MLLNMAFLLFPEKNTTSIPTTTRGSVMAMGLQWIDAQNAAAAAKYKPLFNRKDKGGVDLAVMYKTQLDRKKNVANKPCR